MGDFCAALARSVTDDKVDRACRLGHPAGRLRRRAIGTVPKS